MLWQHCSTWLTGRGLVAIYAVPFMTPFSALCHRAQAFASPVAQLPRFTLHAVLFVGLILGASARAQDTNVANVAAGPAASVIITGPRFPNAPDLAPIGVIEITAAEIKNAGIDNVNEAVRKLAGVYGRQNYFGTSDYDLDLNGFGADSQNNLVVMVDGVRISANEQSPALLSTIPIELVERIEIIRSGSSVLYGDGATGGVILITTRQLGPTPLIGSIFTELGQFHDRIGRVNLAQGGENLNATLNLSEQKSDNYRNNNAVTQQNADGTLTWFTAQGRFGLRVGIARQDSGLPGALSLAQFDQNPRLASNPFDQGSVATDRYTGFFEHTIGAWQLAAELSTREQTVNYDTVSYGYSSSYTGRQTQFTPRLRNLSAIDGLKNELVIGLDLVNWNRQTESPISQDYATQRSHALYLRDEIKLDQARLAVGVRREVFDKTSVDPVPFTTATYAVVQGVNAWEVQGSYLLTQLVNVYAKAGQSYRVANVDDNAYTAEPDKPLLPQLSHDLELGATFGDAVQQMTVRIFRHNISDEIYFDPTANHNFGANTNLDPTRRQGIALDGKLRLSEQFRLNAQLQHLEATFTSGVNDGRELVLVPKNIVSANVSWLPGDGQSAYLGTQWVDTQRYGGDFANTCAGLIPAHASIDARYAKTIGAWEVALTGANLANKQYFTNAYACQGGVYPDDGRQMKVSLRYSF